MAKGKGNRIGLWIIVGLLFIGLLGFGSAGLQSGLRSIGSAGNKTLSAATYDTALREMFRSFAANGVNLTFAQAQSQGYPDQLLSQYVNNRILENEAANLGLSIGDEEVLAQITADPDFRGTSGTFDREQYRYVLGNRGLTEQEHETQVREGLSRQLLQVAVGSGVPNPTAYVDARAAFLGERRSFTWATINASALGSDVPDPTEEDIRAHYDANPDLYTSPEVRQISYVWITPDLLQDQIDVEDSVLQDTYQERIDLYVLPERRLTERLVYPDADAAEAAIARLEAGEVDFDALVAERGLTLNDVDMGDVDIESLGEAGEGVFAAEPGDVVGPFMSEFGPALFRMNAVLSAQETTFEEVRDDLRAEIATSRAARRIAEMDSQIADLVAGGAAIEDLADRTDLEQGQIDWSADVTDGIAAYDNFREAAAAATEGAFPEIVELSDGGLFVLRLDGIIPPALRPFEEVQEQAAEDRRDAATQEAIVEQTNALTTTLATTGDFEAAGLTPITQENLTRREFVAGAPEGFTAIIFDMEEGDVRTMETETGTLIVQLDSIAPADMESETMLAERQDIAERAGAGLAQDIYSIFTEELRDRTDVSIDENAIAQINAQFR